MDYHNIHVVYYQFGDVYLKSYDKTHKKEFSYHQKIVHYYGNNDIIMGCIVLFEIEANQEKQKTMISYNGIKENNAISDIYI